MPSGTSGASSFRDLRKTALFAGIATALSIPIPMWNAARSLIGLGSKYPAWWGIAAMLVAAVCGLSIPAFYICLYLNRGTTLLSKRLQAVSLIGAIALGAATVIKMPLWIRALGPAADASVLTGGQEFWSAGNISTLLQAFSNIACIMPLVALSSSRTSESIPSHIVVKSFRTLAAAVATTWGLVVAFSLLRVALLPVTYAEIRTLTLQFGRTPPNLGAMIAEASSNLLEQFGVFVAPFVVWRSTPRS